MNEIQMNTIIATLTCTHSGEVTLYVIIQINSCSHRSTKADQWIIQMRLSSGTK